MNYSTIGVGANHNSTSGHLDYNDEQTYLVHLDYNNEQNYLVHLNYDYE